jgi:putative two-component system response regulator
MGARIAVCHHERWDGTGYPAGLSGHRIPLDARVTCLVDVYDALSNKRCYHDPWPEDQVVTYIRNQRERLFDPSLVDTFFANYETFRNILHGNPDKPLEPFRDDGDRIVNR